MLTVTKQDLHKFLCEGIEDLDPSLVAALEASDIKLVIADFSMSENHLGGDDLIEFIDNTLEAIREGYTIVTWYGDGTEVLVAGIRPNQIAVGD